VVEYPVIGGHSGVGRGLRNVSFGVCFCVVV